MRARRRRAKIVTDKQKRLRRGPLWGIQKQKKKAGLFVKFVIEVENALPGATGKEKKRWVKQKLDDLIDLPPIAEEISDLVIAIGTEIAYAAVQSAKASDDIVVLEKEEYEGLLKSMASTNELYKRLRNDYATLYTEWTKLKTTNEEPPVQE